jgi:hypothetical protein
MALDLSARNHYVLRYAQGKDKGRARTRAGQEKDKGKGTGTSLVRMEIL